MRGAAITKVVQSKSSKFPVGSYVYATPGWAEYAVLDESTPGNDIVEVPEGGKATDALGVLGKSPDAQFEVLKLMMFRFDWTHRLLRYLGCWSRQGRRLCRCFRCCWSHRVCCLPNCQVEGCNGIGSRWQ